MMIFILFPQLAEMVNLHFLSLLEGLLECNSAILSKLLPIWSPVLFAHYIQVFENFCNLNGSNKEALSLVYD